MLFRENSKWAKLRGKLLTIDNFEMDTRGELIAGYPNRPKQRGVGDQV